MRIDITATIDDALRPALESVFDINSFASALIEEALAEEAAYSRASAEGALRGMEDEPDLYSVSDVIERA